MAYDVVKDVDIKDVKTSSKI